jgi:hypothetical protein
VDRGQELDRGQKVELDGRQEVDMELDGVQEIEVKVDGGSEVNAGCHGHDAQQAAEKFFAGKCRRICAILELEKGILIYSV